MNKKEQQFSVEIGPDMTSFKDREKKENKRTKNMLLPMMQYIQAFPIKIPHANGASFLSHQPKITNHVYSGSPNS